MKYVYTIDVGIIITQIVYTKAKDCTTVLLSVIFHNNIMIQCCGLISLLLYYVL